MTLSGQLWLLLLKLSKTVLIPLLVDDPLWGKQLKARKAYEAVLIPLLVDDPLWGVYFEWLKIFPLYVLIPLLVDDPLWAWIALNYNNGNAGS